MMINKVTRHDGTTIWNLDTDSADLPLGEVLPAAQTQFGQAIDTAAGQARAAFVSPGTLIEQEYQLAKHEAQTWLDGGKDGTAIPSSISDHMAMFGVGAEAAANEIVATAEQWEQALATIRSARLGGKAAVRNAETIEAAELASQAAIAELNAIRPQEGSL
ncbi:hypothetical protein [Halomonas organivorans]|uniref:Phage tail protein n=1 Tax=Halomonas organivorans TaxID=257772 RepID=A0A7W5BYN9_9GAMM|nr:hypothetical protein [Halomonas organivorans]MBB3141219.1 hypothetical protein [Halomonas organivorans]